MENTAITYKTIEQLSAELEEMQYRLDEANDTIEAIRTGQVDALLVQSESSTQLYTLQSADITYRVIIENMTEGALTLSPAGFILYCNSQFTSMTGLSFSEVIGRKFEEFIEEENRGDYRLLLKKCPDENCKGEVLLKTGNRLTPVQLSLATLELEQEKSLSIILTDLTEQKAAQLLLRRNNDSLAAMNLELELSNHDLQQFASVASHDLQEPLRKIQVYSNMLKAKQLDLSQESAGYLAKIIDASARMRSLITDILDYSKLSAEEDFSEPVHLNDLIKEISEDFELSIKDKSAEIEAGALPCVEANKGQMRQVLQNIVNNALKFAKKDVTPVISISAKNIAEKSFSSKEDPAGSYTLLSISDNGIGFDEKYADHIFALFERLNSKEKYEGTGIGLAIAKKIIEKHKGLITATGKEGSGAKFSIILPLKQETL